MAGNLQDHRHGIDLAIAARSSVKVLFIDEPTGSQILYRQSFRLVFGKKKFPTRDQNRRSILGESWI